MPSLVAQNAKTSAGASAWPYSHFSRCSYLAAMYSTAALFDLAQTEHAALFDGTQYPWEVLKKLADYIRLNLRPVQLDGSDQCVVHYRDIREFRQCVGHGELQHCGEH